MELQRDFTALFSEFPQEIEKLDDNLNYLKEMLDSLDAYDWLKADRATRDLLCQTIQQLRNITKYFNDDADRIFDEFNKNSSDGNGCAIDMQHQLAGGKCKITHIVDAKKCICYAIDLNGATASRLKMFWEEVPSLRLQPFIEGPDLNEVFGIEYNSKLNRAKFMFDTNMNMVRVRLIDTGEIIDYGQFNVQKLPHDIKSLSAAAFRCKINQIGDVAAKWLPDSLKGRVFDYKIRTNDESNDLFYIDIHPTNPFWMFNIVDADSDSVISNDVNSSVKDDSYDDDVNANLEQTSNQALQRKCSNHDVNEKLLNGIESAKNGIWNKDDDDGDWDTPDGAEGGGKHNSGTSISTDPQRSNSNTNRYDSATALSVESSRYNRQMGHKGGMKTNHNERYNGQRRSNNQRHHSENDPCGSVRHMKTQCDTTVMESNHHKLRKHRIGEQITIVPTHVLNENEFYGQLGVHYNALQLSQKHLNYRRLLFENEQYTQMPDVGELILVLLEDAFFYRAKVLATLSHHNISVFLLDYGTTHKIDLRFTYKWTDNCDKFPFYAVIFKLENVQINNGSKASKASIFELVKSKIPKTYVSAEVTNINDHAISVRLFDDNGFDIGEEINHMIISNINAAK